MFPIIKLLGEIFTLAVFFSTSHVPRRPSDDRSGATGRRGW